MKTKRLTCSLPLVLIFLVFLGSCRQNSDYYTRGIGVYPGKPSEDFSPQLVSDNTQYRDLALLRPAYHSSSYDYNLTAQLITDGIITNKQPEYISVTTNSETIPKNEREWLFDHNNLTTFGLDGNDVWIQLELSKSTTAPEITSIKLNGNVTYNEKYARGWRVVCEGSDDNSNWHELGRLTGTGLPGHERPGQFRMLRQNKRRDSGRRRTNAFSDFFRSPYGNDSTAPRPSFAFRFGQRKPQRILDLSFEFTKPVKYHFYRVRMSSPAAETWTLGDFDFYNNDTNLIMVPSKYFTSAWMSAGSGTEWVYVDLGSISSFDDIKLHWINKAKKGSVQVSDDALSWKKIAPLPGNDDKTDDIRPAEKTKGRYVRVLMTEPQGGDRYVLSEMEVFGKGGLIPEPKPNPAVRDNKLYLSGGNWKIQRASEVKDTGEEISKPGFAGDNWVIATVPGTALVSYWNAGALPDPNYGDNQLMISESFFNSDFWYRDEFEVPSSFGGKQMFLNFDGINWKADVFVNGKKAGRIEGAFIRGKFDVTGFIKPGQNNAVAVRIIKNAHIGVIKEQTAESPDKNGGILGADNPTFHASIGWDWIPTIRGRNSGIWNDVYLSKNETITIENPFVSSDLPLPDTTSADISIEVTLKNHSTEEVTGTLKGSYGDINFEKEVTIAPSGSKTVTIDKQSVSSLHIDNPYLWWPNGYGQQNLYDVKLVFLTGDNISDRTEFMSGIREMTYSESDGILKIFINGRRFIGRGGNWGFSESNLEYRGREYDAAVAYHADMNFTMIRNWVGQTGDDEFFEACDKYGIMVWQDFWLANPADGPNPDDPAMFMKNAYDFVRRIRNHPSIAIYVGRNEGNPPEVIDTALNDMVKKLHPGLYYIPNSASGTVSGGGPYNALPVRDYFLLYGFNKLHSERGMPNVMTYESLSKTLPDSALWPQNSMWGMHDYCLEGAQRASSFNEMI
ncbi:MAG TPA: discoidin domain-containing protein, partial [Bacteroidales bacterium]|nr:discoidin domain-containing protein [Bacteroidales bacterium]